MAEDSVLAPKFAPFIGMCWFLDEASYLASYDIDDRTCADFAPLQAGIAAAMIFGCIGAAYGTAKSGIGIAGCLIPVVMSGIIAVYSLVISVLIAQDLTPPGAGSNYSLFNGFMHLACGLSVGLTGLAAGYTIGIVGDKGVRSYMEQSRIFVGMVLILIFGEVLGLYGYAVMSLFVVRVSTNPYRSLIVALILNTKSKG
ncbi:V-type proton ATPase proteolipid subunit 2 [Colletotrichum higginsianum]|nr:V-type proton ATPase proteolipid subunit 2 [Colletotrichum higginsianum]